MQIPISLSIVLSPSAGETPVNPFQELRDQGWTPIVLPPRFLEAALEADAFRLPAVLVELSFDGETDGEGTPVVFINASDPAESYEAICSGADDEGYDFSWLDPTQKGESTLNRMLYHETFTVRRDNLPLKDLKVGDVVGIHDVDDSEVYEARVIKVGPRAVTFVWDDEFVDGEDSCGALPLDDEPE